MVESESLPFLFDIVQGLVLLWLILKLGKLEKEIDFKMKVPMYALFRHLAEEHNKP